MTTAILLDLLVIEAVLLPHLLLVAMPLLTAEFVHAVRVQFDVAQHPLTIQDLL